MFCLRHYLLFFFIPSVASPHFTLIFMIAFTLFSSAMVCHVQVLLLLMLVYTAPSSSLRSFQARVYGETGVHLMIQWDSLKCGHL